MASVVTEKNGRQRVSFKGIDGKRRTLRLGLVPPGEARAVAGHVQTIVDAAVAGIVLDGCNAAEIAGLPEKLRPHALATVSWLAALDVERREKLAAVGLVPSQESIDIANQVATLG